MHILISYDFRGNLLENVHRNELYLLGNLLEKLNRKSLHYDKSGK